MARKKTKENLHPMDFKGNRGHGGMAPCILVANRRPEIPDEFTLEHMQREYPGFCSDSTSPPKKAAESSSASDAEKKRIQDRLDDEFKRPHGTLIPAKGLLVTKDSTVDVTPDGLGLSGDIWRDKTADESENKPPTPPPEE